VIKLVLTLVLYTAGRREKIEEMLRYIETRLKELEDEKEELKAYQELDRERRALEYTLYTKELQSTNETLRRVLTCH
jgi:structural maintenance of chromosome 3 (chondroitin sulfate proteoglycan 6)